jgi:WD40 repeat protein/tetratricopeptide (TPR) repeat protein
MSAGASNPFPGLRPFRTEEHHLFFGREEQIAELLGLLRQHRFLAVVGTSGSGKSSLVRAGLIPALHRGTLTRAGSSWEVVLLRPGGDPIANLARALIEARIYDAEDPESLPRLKATLARSRYGLVEAVRQSELEPASNLLVVIDQFEELFRFRRLGSGSEEAASAFVRLLLTASEQSEQRIYAAITMRSDYLGDCAQIPGLPEAVNLGEYLIPRLSREQKRDAIEKPVGVGGGRIAPRLVQRMLNDVGDDPDQLPVLQHALMRAWDAWAAAKQPGEAIDLEHYESIGGMEEALSRHADEVFLALPDDHHRDACARIFRALTEKGTDNRGVRRPTRLERLELVTGAGRDVVWSVIEAFRGPGVTFLMPGPEQELQGRTVIDLSHESLMRGWARLRDWVEVEAQSARIYRRLAETAELWKEGRAGLFRDPDLQITLSWRDAARPNAAWAEQSGGGFELAMEFLDHSRDAARTEELAREEARRRELEAARALAEIERRRAEERQRSAKRMKALAGGVALVAAVALVASIFAVIARREALENAELARASELAAMEAASRLQATAVEGDFRLGVERLEAGNGASGLSHLARALRTDPSYWPAAVRTMSALQSGRYSLAELELIEQRRVITDFWLNPKADVVYTSDVGAAGSEMPERFVWDLRSGRKLYAVGEGAKNLFLPQWTEDGTQLFVYFPDERTLRGFEARSGTEVSTVRLSSSSSLFALGSHAEHGQLVLVLYGDYQLQTWKASSSTALSPRFGRGVPVTRGVGFTPDGRIWVGYGDRLIAIHDAESGEPGASLSIAPHDLRAEAIFFSPGGEYLVVREASGRWLNWWPMGTEAAGAGARGPAETGTGWLEFEAPVEAWFLPSGARLALAWQDPQTRRLQVAVHDVASRERTAFLESPSPPSGLVYLADERPGTRLLRFPLLGAIWANEVRIWDLETAGVLQSILAPSILGQPGSSGPRSSSRDVLFSPDGRRVATISLERKLMLWDIFTGRPLLSQALEHQGAVSMTFSPDGGKLVTHDRERRILEVWDSRSGRRLIEPLPQVNPPALHFTSQGDRLVLYEAIHTTLDSDRMQTLGRLRLLELGLRPALSEPLLDPRGHEAAADFTPDGSRIVIFAKPRPEEPDQVMVWETSGRRLLRSLPLPGVVHADEGSLRMTRDGRRVVLGCEDRRARVWDLESGAQVHELEHEAAVHVTAFSADGSRLATATSGGRLRVWDLADGTPLFESLEGGTEPIQAVLLSADGSTVGWVATGRDSKFHLVDVASGEPKVGPLLLPGWSGSAVLGPDGIHAAVVPFAPEVWIIELAGGAVTRRLSHLDSCRSAVFSPDGRLLAVGGGLSLEAPVGEVVLWDWREGRQVGPVLQARGAVSRLAFSRDGSMLATGTVLRQRGSVQVWHVASGQPLTEPIAGGAHVSSVAFHPEGTILAAAWADGAVRLVDLPPRAVPVPSWLPRLAEAVGGQKLLAGSAGREAVPQEELAEVRREVEAGGKADEAVRWARWYLADPESRAISAGSAVTFSEYLQRFRRSPRAEDLEAALLLAPSDALTHGRLAQVLLDLGRERDQSELERRHWRDTAEWYSRRAVELDPADPEVWALRVKVLERIGDGAGAAAALSRAVELERSWQSASANVRLLEAEALARRGKWDAAEGAFEVALERLSPAQASAGGGGEGVRAPAAPLLGPLQYLEPYRIRPGFRELRLPAPIPGSFEDFDAVFEGRLPAGWKAAHEVEASASSAIEIDTPPPDAPSFHEPLDWRVLSVPRLSGYPSSAPATSRFRQTAGMRFLAGRVNGALEAQVLRARFLFAPAAGEEQDRVQVVETPAFDCSGRAGVHVVFHSVYVPERGGMGAIEYTIDGGASWLPVAYQIDSTSIVRGPGGQIDAIATLSKERDEVPRVSGADGKPRGGSYAAFLSAPLRPELAAAILGRPRSNWTDPQRLEVFRLSRADGQKSVSLRFTFAGRVGGWGIDRFGLYELTGAALQPVPEFVDRAVEPRMLARLGIEAVLGGSAWGGTVQWLRPDDLALLPPLPLETAGSLRDHSRMVSPIEAQLLLRRAAKLAGQEVDVLLAAAAVAALSGDLEAAISNLRRALALERPGSLWEHPLASVFAAVAEARDRDGDVVAAAVAYEIVHLLLEAVGASHPAILERLAARGLLVENVVLLPRGADWRYFDEGTDPGAEWKQPSFADGNWLDGRARLGFGNDGEITLLRPGPPTSRHVTFYFRTAFEVDNPQQFRQLRLSIQRDDGVACYLNGHEVVRDNLPAGGIRLDTLATRTQNDADEQRFFEFHISPRWLRRGRNVIAAEVHQSTRNSSDLGFDLMLEGIGGLGDPLLEGAELEDAERRLEVPDELRSVLWASRGERFRRAGRAAEARKALEQAARLGPGNPRPAYDEAFLLAEAGEEEAAYRRYIEAAAGVIALKQGRGFYASFLPRSLKLQVEPLIEASGAALARAARDIARGDLGVGQVEAEWLLRWSAELDSTSPEALRLRAQALFEIGKHEEALAAVDALLVAPPLLPEALPAARRRHKEILRLREIHLERLGRGEEAEKTRRELFSPPPRDPRLSPKLIDLSPHYNASLYDPRAWHDGGEVSTLKSLAETFRPRGGIDFDIRGLIQLNSGLYSAAAGEYLSGKDVGTAVMHPYPDEVSGIRVGLATPALHFLLSTIHGRVPSGIEVARIVVHYEDGSRAEIPLNFGEDVADWAYSQALARERIAWQGGRPVRYLSLKSWRNPHPGKPIRHLDFISTRQEAAPFLAGVTAE